MMLQSAPYPVFLEQLVKQMSYKPGWRFELEEIDRGQGSHGLTLIISITAPDTYQPTNPIRVNHYMIVPAAAYDIAAWTRWLLDQILLVEQHEAAEFFKVGEDRPFAPNHAPGRNPYSIIEQGTYANATTDYKGKRFDPAEREK